MDLIRATIPPGKGLTLVIPSCLLGLLCTLPGPGAEYKLTDPEGRPLPGLQVEIIVVPKRHTQPGPTAIIRPGLPVRLGRSRYYRRPWRAAAGVTDSGGRVRLQALNGTLNQHSGQTWLVVRRKGGDFPIKVRWPAPRGASPPTFQVGRVAWLSLGLDPALPGRYRLAHITGVTVAPVTAGHGRILAFPTLAPGLWWLSYAPPVPAKGRSSGHRIYNSTRVKGLADLFLAAPPHPVKVVQGANRKLLSTAGWTPGRLLVQLRTHRGPGAGLPLTLGYTFAGKRYHCSLGKTDRAGRLGSLPVPRGRCTLLVSHPRYRLNLLETRLDIRPGGRRILNRTLATGDLRVLVKRRPQPEGAEEGHRLQVRVRFQTPNRPSSRNAYRYGSTSYTLQPDRPGLLRLPLLPAGLVVELTPLVRANGWTHYDQGDRITVRPGETLTAELWYSLAR